MNSSNTEALPPWKRSWFYCAPGEVPTLVWIGMIHVLSVVGLCLLPLPPAWALWVAFALYCLGALGTTVAYHRVLAHHTATIKPWIERPMVFFGIFNGSGDPLTWAANHRHHHAHSDGPLDVSSPRHGGFWWAHLRWLWQAQQASTERYTPDLIREGHAVWRKFQVAIVVLSLGFGAVFLLFMPWQAALAAWLWVGPVRLVLALHAQCSVNSLCHLGPLTAEHGSGKNVWWMTPFHVGQGENWHANHHSDPNDPRLGRKWWQVDFGWWCLAGLHAIGAARVTMLARERSRRD
ncbi:MAG: fatty acid desaturase [Planctomycetes bacterium]|nr:fatty acid desaturase [Planctomycetota bacterium]